MSGPVKHLTAEDYLAEREGRPPERKPRDAMAQIEALLTITDRQVRNLENAGILSGQETRQLLAMVDAVVRLSSAVSRSGHAKDPSKMSEDELREVAGE